MKVHKDLIIPAHTVKKCVKRICDLCGKEANPHGEWKKESCYKVNETKIVEIKHREGSSYPGVGYGEEIEFDLCPDCFRNKLVVWLKSQGAKIDYVEYDY